MRLCLKGVQSMEWLNNLTGGENGSAINLIIITLAMVFLLIVVGWIFRKFSGTAAKKAMRSRVPRLSITDTTKIDEKRWMVMVRRDNVEHLILIGGSNDLVVESNIVRAQVPQKPSVTPQENIAPAAVQERAENAVLENETAATPSITAPIAGVAAVGAAGLSAVTTVATTVTDTATSVVSSVADTSGDVTNAVTETATETVKAVTEKASDAVESVTETVTPEAGVDLESQISATLDDALSIEDLDIKPNEEPATPTIASDAASSDANPKGGDDEMQRLLDELSSEMKEPA